MIEHLDARPAVRRWLAHPAVPTIVATCRPPARAALAALPLTDAVDVAAFVARALDVALDDGTGELPLPTLTPEQAAAAPGVAAVLVAIVGQALAAAATVGVPLDARSAVDAVLMGQLLTCDVPVGPAAVDALVVPGVAGWTRDLDGTHVSRHADRGAERAVAAHRRRLAARAGLGHLPGPYAGGKQRRPPERTERAVAALRTVLAEHPGVTAGQLLTTWAAGPATPGGRLRRALLLQPQDAPSRATLARWLKAAGPS